MREKLVGQFDKEKDKFMNKPDTKFQPSIDQRLPETKKFAYANQVSDFGLNDMISDKKFRFENVNNSILLGEQLPDDRPFKISLGIKGINDHFDSMAPNKDYRYTDPQFYEYKLKDMTQQKIAETNWRVQGDTTTNPDDLDGYARAIAYATEYKRSKEAKSSPPSVQSSQQSSPEKNSNQSSRVGSRRNSGDVVDLTGSNLVNKMEELERGGIKIDPPKTSSRGSNHSSKKSSSNNSPRRLDLDEHMKMPSFANQMTERIKQSLLQDEEMERSLMSKNDSNEETPKKKKQESIPPEQPSKQKKDSTLNIWSSSGALALTTAQKIKNISDALKDLDANFKSGKETQIGSGNVPKFLKYHITINGNSKWSTAKSLLESQFKKLNNGSTATTATTDDISTIFASLKGKQQSTPNKKQRSLSFDDTTGGNLEFEKPTPQGTRANSRASEAKKTAYQDYVAPQGTRHTKGRL